MLIHGFPCPVCRTTIYGGHCSYCAWEDPVQLRERAKFMEAMMKPKNAAKIRQILKRTFKK